MPEHANALNDVLVKLFNRILSIEEEAITKASALGLTMSEIHVIEAIGDMEPRSMSEVAADLGVTIGTLTASVNRLVHKGHVTRSRPRTTAGWCWLPPPTREWWPTGCTSAFISE